MRDCPSSGRSSGRYFVRRPSPYTKIKYRSFLRAYFTHACKHGDARRLILGEYWFTHIRFYAKRLFLFFNHSRRMKLPRGKLQHLALKICCLPSWCRFWKNDKSAPHLKNMFACGARGHTYRYIVMESIRLIAGGNAGIGYYGLCRA